MMKRLKRYLAAHARELCWATLFDIACFGAAFFAGTQCHGQQVATYVGHSYAGNVYMAPGPQPVAYVVPSPYRCPVVNWLFTPRTIIVLPPVAAQVQPQPQGVVIPQQPNYPPPSAQ